MKHEVQYFSRHFKDLNEMIGSSKHFKSVLCILSVEAVVNWTRTMKNSYIHIRKHTSNGPEADSLALLKLLKSFPLFY